jgi:general secretion pathway protein F
MAEEIQFRYVAVDRAGRRVKGALAARSDAMAFERLKRDGLSPLHIRRDDRRSSTNPNQLSAGLSDRDSAAFLSDLAVLLKAGADMRGALSILGAKGGQSAVRNLARALMAEISGGGAVDQAFEANMGKKQTFVGALVAAGEAAGDLSGGLQRAAEMLESRVKLRDQLVSVLSYPTFVFTSTLLAVAVILLFVVPSLAPLVGEAGGDPPLALKILISASDLLRENLIPIAASVGLGGVGVFIAGSLGLLTGPVERLLLDGPASRTTGGLAFGAFAISLGNMLSAGAPMSDALRLAIRSVRSAVARARLQAVAQEVRQGESLSFALEHVKHFPPTILRLAAVGEASGALGTMLERGGRIEEEQAIRRIEAIGRILGPALIVALGGLVGLLMAGLLSGVSQLGQAALQ